MWCYIVKDKCLKCMTNKINDANRFLLQSGYGIKNIREGRGAYIIEVF